MNFIDRKVSNTKAVVSLAKNGIEVNEEEVAVILNFLYLMAKIHNRKIVLKDTNIPKEKSNMSNNCLM